MTERDPNVKKQIFKTLRLWGLSLICALVGSLTVGATDSIGFGVLAFLGSLAVLGPVLWFYERRGRA